MLTFATAEALARTHGDAFYLFDSGRFSGNFEDFRRAFVREYGNTRLAYSYKSNYTPAICKLVDGLGGYAEVVSEMEFDLALALGVDCRKIVYNGPFKSPLSIRRALLGGAIVNLDSARDLALLAECAAENAGSRMTVAIRCNLALDGYRESRFGFDVVSPDFSRAIKTIREMHNVRFAGLHCHYQDRDLNSFKRRTKELIAVAETIFIDAQPDFLNVGGGFFGRMPESMKQSFSAPVPDYEEYAAAVGTLMRDCYGAAESGPILFVEPGTALVADTFEFVTRVIDKKRIRGRTYLYVAGSMFNVSPNARFQGLPVSVLGESGRSEGETVDVAGYTCIESDLLSKGIQLSAEPGDFLVYGNVGSYSVVMKPPFILPNVPILEAQGHEIVKRAETMEDVFATFVR